MARPKLPVPPEIEAILRAEYPRGKTIDIARKSGISPSQIRVMAEDKLKLCKDPEYKREQNIWRAESLKQSRAEQNEPKERIRKIPGGIEHRCL